MQCVIFNQAIQNSKIAKGMCSKANPVPLQEIAHEVISSALGIHSANSEHPTRESVLKGNKPALSNEFSLPSARNKSAHFFHDQSQLSNCPPRVVFGCLGLMSVLIRPEFGGLDKLLELQDETLVNAVLHEFETAPKGTPPNIYNSKLLVETFITRYVSPGDLPFCDPTHLMIALYIQGCRYHNSQSRRQGLPILTRPLQVLPSRSFH